MSLSLNILLPIAAHLLPAKERGIMSSQQRSKASSQRASKEIDALLKRLHSGCRFILFEDVNNKKDISNTLRNAAQPDEVHSELGRALANSYLDSLDDDDDVGERILSSLCCGEDIESNNSSNSNKQTGKSNYASVANALFSYLAEYWLANKYIDEYNISATREKLHQKWLQWCVRCEELTIPPDEIGRAHV